MDTFFYSAAGIWKKCSKIEKRNLVAEISVFSNLRFLNKYSSFLSVFGEIFANEQRFLGGKNIPMNHKTQPEGESSYY